MNLARDTSPRSLSPKELTTYQQKRPPNNPYLGLTGSQIAEGFADTTRLSHILIHNYLESLSWLDTIPCFQPTYIQPCHAHAQPCQPTDEPNIRSYSCIVLLEHCTIHSNKKKYSGIKNKKRQVSNLRAVIYYQA